MKTTKIIIHCESQIAKEIDILKLKKFTTDLFPIKVEHNSRHILFDDQNKNNQTIAASRIYDIKNPPAYITAHKNKSEIHTMRNNPNNETEPIYDGFELCKIAENIIHADKKCTALSQLTNTTSPNTTSSHQQCKYHNTLNIIFTDIITCTFDQDDYRYHARMLVGANPFLISVSGMVKGPARPKEYYIKQLTREFSAHMNNNIQDRIDNNQTYNNSIQSNAHTTIITDNKNHDYITRHDLRIPHIAQGLLLQAIIYYETGEAFCSDNTCRIYNAHWQKDMIRTQITEQKLCNKHYNAIKKMQNSK